MTKEQVNGIMQFVQQNCETGVSYALAVMDKDGTVKCTFSANAIQLCFMERVLNDAVGKLMQMPAQAPPPKGPTLVGA